MVDTVRASRDGHEYHETWIARAALRLLLPKSDLCGIAVEGLHPAEQKNSTSEAVDVADAVFFDGDLPSFKTSRKTSIVQFKYSISDAKKDFRASNAKKTITKFAKAYLDYRKNFGAKRVQERLYFQLTTNRPIYSHLHLAIEAIAANKPTKGDTKKQADQFTSASGLQGSNLRQFASKCKFVGLTGDLRTTKGSLKSMMIDWSSTNDAMAKARLGDLKQLVRDKAGHAGEGKNVIERTDVLAALEIADREELLPCPSVLAKVKHVVAREQLGDAVEMISNSKQPVLVLAPGGVGKTVFMESLANTIRDKFETVFFDCFGGGAYRSPEDARHLAKHGLIQIANTLAFRGMCDPILPGANDVSSLLRTFRRRIEQGVKTLERLAKGKRIAILIDAIDNADIHANESGEKAFPVLLLESISEKPIEGLQLIVSSRPERKPSTHADLVEFPLKPFSPDETRKFVLARRSKTTDAELRIAQARSGGNPRVLEYLVESERLVGESNTSSPIELDELIEGRIDKALSEARKRGQSKQSIDMFLSGLAVLPPPVPLEEFSSVHGITTDAVESFASDINPLLERTNHGLLFRDEPTETFVRQNYGLKKASAKKLADSMWSRQDSSVYAANALPGLLHKLNDGKRLFQLAFDGRIPSEVVSTVGKRNVRYSRLKAACVNAAARNDHNQLVQLMVELSTFASVDQRGVTYLLNYPDLVIAAKDTDATRGLFEAKTIWPGTRHARLAIANTLSEDMNEACRHSYSAVEWIRHYMNEDPEKKRFRQVRSGPSQLDLCAVAFQRIAEGDLEGANSFLNVWKSWFVFESSQNLFDLMNQLEKESDHTRQSLNKFLDTHADGVGLLTASLAFGMHTTSRTKKMIERLAKRCVGRKRVEHRENYVNTPLCDLRNGLFKAAALALALKKKREAKKIMKQTPVRRPGTWAFREQWFRADDIVPFILKQAISFAATDKPIHEKDLLAAELTTFCSRIPKRLSGEEFRKSCKKRLSKIPTNYNDERSHGKDEDGLSEESKGEIQYFLDHRLQPLFDLSASLSKFLKSSDRSVNKAFRELIQVWRMTRNTGDRYHSQSSRKLFQIVGREVALYAFWTRSKLNLESAKEFLACLQEQNNHGPEKLIQVVSILARRPGIELLAAEQSLEAARLVEQVNDVDERSKLYADLARAILPVSKDDAKVYFLKGFDQTNAYGSGDYQLTSELLWFASAVKGKELGEKDFHTLSNICELNIWDEPEKFPWAAFAAGMSKVAGVRMLAKLSRWNDRSKVDLSCTLMPFLTALLRDKKINSEDAVILNLLANPIELYISGSREFANAVGQRDEICDPFVVQELIDQYVRNNLGVPSSETVCTLARLAANSLGKSNDFTSYLTQAEGQFKRVNDTRNDHYNRRSKSDAKMLLKVESKKKSEKKKVVEIVARTNPIDSASFETGVVDLYSKEMIQHTSEFLRALRSKVKIGKRGQYVKNLAELENVKLHFKLDEFTECKESWASSTVSIESVFHEVALPLAQLHLSELVREQWGLSTSDIAKISQISGRRRSEIVLAIIQTLTVKELNFSGEVWLGLASIVSEDSNRDNSKKALERLLRSDATLLSSSVQDGGWRKGIYTDNKFQTVAAGLIWRQLGSPYVAERWRAAHCIRRLADFGRWKIINSVVARIDEKGAGCFAAEELPFFYKHAKLWLLIALARISRTHSKHVAKYKTTLLAATKTMHLIQNHFAANALINCFDSGDMKLSNSAIDKLRKIDQSPLPKLDTKIRTGGFYDSFSEKGPFSEDNFSLEYDFEKHDIEGLSEAFGKSNGEVQAMVSKRAKEIDSTATSMYDTGGRASNKSESNLGIGDKYQTHGQQLGYHALFEVAGQLKAKHPVTADSWRDNPFEEWIESYQLSREDGTWISDGTDWPPLDVRELLKEDVKGNLGLISDRKRLLNLAGITSTKRISKQLTVHGYWHSIDNVRVRISSALVDCKRSNSLAKQLIKENAINSWLPWCSLNDDGSESAYNEKPGYEPWVVDPDYFYGRLDKLDPYGCDYAIFRPRIHSDISIDLGLQVGDQYGRVWRTKRDAIAIQTEVWGTNNDGENKQSGCRLECTPSVLRKILEKRGQDLLLLIKLEHYMNSSYEKKSQFSHSIGVVKISKNLEYKFYHGAKNQVTQTKHY